MKHRLLIFGLVMVSALFVGVLSSLDADLREIDQPDISLFDSRAYFFVRWYL